MNKYTVKEDKEEDCLLVKYEEDFEEEVLVLAPIEDARIVVNRLNFLEKYCEFLEDYLGYSQDDLKSIRSEALYNLDED